MTRRRQVIRRLLLCMGIAILVLYAVAYLRFDISMAFQKRPGEQLPDLDSITIVGKTYYEICKLLGKPDAVRPPQDFGTFFFHSPAAEKVYVYNSLRTYIFFAKGQAFATRGMKVSPD